MKEYYIVKKSVKRGILKTKNKISIEEYQQFIDNHQEFTWLENTIHGKKWDKVRPIRKKLRAYLNYDFEDEQSFVHLLYSIGGYVNVKFDYKITYQNLLKLIQLVEEIDSNLWQIKPTRIIVNCDYLKKYKKK